MRRSELEKAVQNIVELIDETSLHQFLRTLNNMVRVKDRTLDEPTKDVLFKIFKDVVVKSQSFGRIENEILAFFGLENFLNLLFGTIWLAANVML